MKVGDTVARKLGSLSLLFLVDSMCMSFKTFKLLFATHLSSFLLTISESVGNSETL